MSLISKVIINDAIYSLYDKELSTHLTEKYFEKCDYDWSKMTSAADTGTYAMNKLYDSGYIYSVRLKTTTSGKSGKVYIVESTGTNVIKITTYSFTSTGNVQDIPINTAFDNSFYVFVSVQTLCFKTDSTAPYKCGKYASTLSFPYSYQMAVGVIRPKVIGLCKKDQITSYNVSLDWNTFTQGFRRVYISSSDAATYPFVNAPSTYGDFTVIDLEIYDGTYFQIAFANATLKPTLSSNVWFRTHTSSSGTTWLS